MRRDRLGLVDRMLIGGAAERWARLARNVDATPLPDLDRQTAEARRQKQVIDAFLHLAEGRLVQSPGGLQVPQDPADADWVWRPDLWSGPLAVPGRAAVASGEQLGDEATLFHDCTRSEITLRQLRDGRGSDPTGFGLRIDVFAFDGSYLSLAIDLPETACEGLRRKHLLRLDTVVEMETPREIFARLNVKHGPNVEQLVRELPLDEPNSRVEFDLAYTKLNEKRIEKMWLDLIFEAPEMNQVVLRDLTLSRRPRAEL